MTNKANCETHGDFDQLETKLMGGRIMKHPCPKCVDDRRKAETEKEAAADLRRVADLRRARLAAAEILPRYNKANLDDFDADIKQQALEWVSKKDWRTLLIVGQLNTGKTHLAAAIVREWCKTATGLFTTTSKMFETINRDRSPDKFIAPMLLAIDEVGRTTETEARENSMFEVVNERYGRNLPLIIVGNVKAQEYLDGVGDATERRLRDGISVIVMNKKVK